MFAWPLYPPVMRRESCLTCFPCDTDSSTAAGVRPCDIWPTSAPQNHATDYLPGSEQAPCADNSLLGKACVWKLAVATDCTGHLCLHRVSLGQAKELQHLPGVSCAIFPVHKILNLRPFLCICNDSNSPQFFDFSNFARVLRSYSAVPVLSLSSASERGLMASDLMQTAMIDAQLGHMPDSMPYGTTTSWSWVTGCIAGTSATATGFHQNSALRPEVLLPSLRCCMRAGARCRI